MESGSGGVEYVRCAATSKCWFPVMQEYGDGTRQAVTLPSLYALNEDGLYNLLIREDCLVVYSGEETDFGIGASKMQNGTFLLKAVAGNLYQHPTTGVGLLDFLHSNMENNGLAEMCIRDRYSGGQHQCLQTGYGQRESLAGYGRQHRSPYAECHQGQDWRLDDRSDGIERQPYPA